MNSQEYCVYSGKNFPAAEMSGEHIIPLSLGGANALSIRCCTTLNSKIGNEIDKIIAEDPIVKAGRVHARAIGHSGKAPIQTWNGGNFFNPSVYSDTAIDRVRYSFDGNVNKLQNIRTRENVPIEKLNESALVFPLKISTDARLKFAAKTLLGIGYFRYGATFLDSIDANPLRQIIQGTATIAKSSIQNKIGYSDEFLATNDDERLWIKSVRDATVVGFETTALLCQANNSLIWAISCCGYLIGVISVPLKNSIFKIEYSKNAIHMVVKKGNNPLRIKEFQFNL